MESGIFWEREGKEVKKGTGYLFFKKGDSPSLI